MKANFELMNFNGANSPVNFDTIKDAKKWLNELFYYSEDLILTIKDNYHYQIKYSETNDIRQILSEANFYNSVVCVHVIFE